MDANEEVMESDEHSLDPYDLLRDPFALIPPEVVEHWDAKKKPHSHPQTQQPLIPESAESQSVCDPDDLRTTDSEDDDSTDVSYPYRNARWTEEAP